MRTILLLVCSNVFMTFAWYGHLKYGHDWPLWKAILVSWAIALLEYCLAVPANRLGFGQFSGFQLKIIQEVVTLVVFVGFAVAFLKEKLAWNYLVAFAFLGVAVFFAFAFKAPGLVAPNSPGRRHGEYALGERRQTNPKSSRCQRSRHAPNPLISPPHQCFVLTGPFTTRGRVESANHSSRCRSAREKAGIQTVT